MNMKSIALILQKITLDLMWGRSSMVSKDWFFLWIPFKETAGSGTVVGLSLNGAFGRLSLGLLTGRSLVESTLTSCVALTKL